MALIQDKGAVAKGQGMYYHDAMLNGRANQLSEMVPVDRIYSEFGRYIKAGATEYMLLNTSDLRAVSMTAKAVMDTAWGGVPEGRRDGHLRWLGDKPSSATRRPMRWPRSGTAISRPFPRHRLAMTMATRFITPRHGRC